MRQRLSAALAALDRWWFAPTQRYQLGVFRVLLVSWLAWFHSQRLFPRLELATGRPLEFYDPPSLAHWLGIPLPVNAAQVELCKAIAVPLIALALIGLATRAALILLAVLNLILGLSANAWGYTAHASALPAVVLCIIAFAPGVTSFSVDAALVRVLARWRGRPVGTSAPELLPRRPVSIWPVRAVLVFICLLYFTAGLSKLRHAGWRWADGQTLSFYLGGGSLRGDDEVQRFFRDPAASSAQKFRDGYGLVDYAYVGRPTALGLWVARRPYLVQGLAWGSLLLELLFPLALLGRRPQQLVLLSGVGFHLGIGFTLRINFASYLVCYALFLDWSRLLRKLSRSSDPSGGDRAFAQSSSKRIAE